MLRRALRLTVPIVVLIATASTPRQGGAASGGPLPARMANPARPPTAVGWQAPRRLRSVGGAGARPAGVAGRAVAAIVSARAASRGARGQGAVAAGAARDVAPDYGNLPLAFEPNVGQTDPSVAYLAHGQGYTAFLTQDGITLALAPPGPPTRALPGATPAPLPTPAPAPGVRIAFQGASAQAQPVAQDPLPGTVNYLVGNDASTWHTGIPTYGQVSYPDVYPGVDLVYHGQGDQVAFDFVVNPGALASAIRLQLEGVDGAAPNSQGDLVIGAAGRTLRALLPTAYQDIAGQRHPVGAHYRLLGGDAVGLTLDSYDASQPVTIDPVLVYSSYLGGSGDDQGLGAAVGGSGAPYVTGLTASTNFPTVSPEQGSNAGGDDAFVAKLAGPSCTVGTVPTSSGAVPWHPHYAARITSLLGLSVDLADGHADLSASNLAVAGRGPDLVVQHTWDSTLALGCTASSNGSGWRSDLTRSMSGAPGSTVTYTDATGARWVFPYVGGAYQPPAGLPWSLTAGGSVYTLTNILTGEKLQFDSQGRYTQDTDAYGNYNVLTQSGSGAPTSEKNQNSGRALTMTYANGLLDDLQSPIYHGSGPMAADGQHVVFGYDGQELTGLTWGGQTTDAQSAHLGYTWDLLTSVTTPMTLSGTLAVTRVWTLGYDASNRLISITSPISGTSGPGSTLAYTTLFT